MKILQAKYLISNPDVKGCPNSNWPEYAFIGRSNVGKSSLINMLCNHDKLAKTSASPGKTQLINHFQITSETETGRKKDWYLVDLPGYGFAKVSISSRRRWEQMIEHYLKERANLSMVFVLLDARHAPQKIDLAFLENCKKWGVPVCLIFTKSDKENQRTVSANVRAFLDEMKKTWQFLPQHFVSSAIKKTGRDKILSCIESLNEDFQNQNAV